MNRTASSRDQWLARFEEVHDQWSRGQMTQVRAASLVGLSERTFRRYTARYREKGLNGLEDGRRAVGSLRSAPAREVDAVLALYAESYAGLPVSRFYREYQGRHGGKRSHSWVRKHLISAGLVEPGRTVASPAGPARRNQPEGRLLHQHSWTTHWTPGKLWALVATLDDASSRVYSGFFLEQDGPWSWVRGIRETLVARGKFAAICVDHESFRGSSRSATQFRRAMNELGTDVISPRRSVGGTGCYDVFRVLRCRLPQHLVHMEIESIEQANAYLRGFWAGFNAFFALETTETDAFEPLDPNGEEKLTHILSMRATPQVGKDS